MTKKLLLIGLIISLGVNLYFFLNRGSTPENEITMLHSSTKLTSPSLSNLIDSNSTESGLILHYSGLRDELISLIDANNVSTASAGIFLQDVKTGAWLGINEREGFAPASLLKVPLLMATLKRVERGEINFDQSVELTKVDLDKDAGELYKRGAGAKLTVWELLKHMILTSDNTAKNAIKRQLLPVEINAVFAHIGIPNPYDSLETDSVTPRGYSRIFKSLYHSSFLTPELSEKALDLATDTQVESLLAAGVPPEIQVAHKYGERPDGLSDCGIIYYPKNPYFLCIMVKDTDIKKTKRLISSVSEHVYNFISK